MPTPSAVKVVLAWVAYVLVAAFTTIVLAPFAILHTVRQWVRRYKVRRALRGAWRR